jgi:ribosomal protein L18
MRQPNTPNQHIRQTRFSITPYFFTEIVLQNFYKLNSSFALIVMETSAKEFLAQVCNATSSITRISVSTRPSEVTSKKRKALPNKPNEFTDTSHFIASTTPKI